MNLVVVSAHADDAELGCGGTIARAVREGHAVTIVVVTEPTHEDRPEWRDELLGAARILGVGVMTPRIRQEGFGVTRKLISDLGIIFGEVAPDMVIAMCGTDTHQDHRATFDATLAASRNIKTVLSMECCRPARLVRPFHPRAYVTFTEDDLAKKIMALKAHRSQVEIYGEAWLEEARARARVRGSETNAMYAEAFDVMWSEVEL